MIELAEQQSAFPHRNATPENSGMLLLDYFAAKAMQSLLANGEVNVKDVAKASYLQARAMMEERSV